MPAVIVIKVGKQHRSLVLRGPTVIGRADTCTLRVESRRVSRQHVRIDGRDHAWFIEDLGSRNGTWVNGQQIQEPHQFRARDRVDIGDVRVVFLVLETLTPTLDVRRREGPGFLGDAMFRCGACRQKIVAPFYMASSLTRCPRCRVRLMVPATPDEMGLAPRHENSPAHLGAVDSVEVVVRPEVAPPPEPPVSEELPPVPGESPEVAASGAADHVGLIFHDRPSRATASDSPVAAPAARNCQALTPRASPALSETGGISAGWQVQSPRDAELISDIATAADWTSMALTAGGGIDPSVAWSDSRSSDRSFSMASTSLPLARSAAFNENQLRQAPRDVRGDGNISNAAHVQAGHDLAASVAFARATKLPMTRREPNLSTAFNRTTTPAAGGPSPAASAAGPVGVEIGVRVSGSGLFDLIPPRPPAPPQLPRPIPVPVQGGAPSGLPPDDAVPIPVTAEDPDQERELKVFEALRDRAGGYWAALSAGRAASRGRIREVALQAKSFDGISDADLRGQLAGLHHHFRQGRHQREHRDTALALGCQAMRRAVEGFPAASQIAAALAMEAGCIAVLSVDSRMGVALSAMLAGLRGRGCHVLVGEAAVGQRDAERFCPFFHLCGMTVGAIEATTSPVSRRSAYFGDVTYLTPATVVVDYYREQQANPVVPPGHPGASGAPGVAGGGAGARAPRRGPAPPAPGHPGPITGMRGLEFAILTDASATLDAELSVAIAPETQKPDSATNANARVRLPQFLKMYRRLRGVTTGDGTLRRELWKVYQVPVVPIITRLRR